MKKLAIFPSQVSIAGTQIYSDFARSTGWQLEEDSLDADAAVICSMYTSIIASRRNQS